MPSGWLSQVASSRRSRGRGWKEPIRRHTTSSPNLSTYSRPSASPQTFEAPYSPSGRGGCKPSSGSPGAYMPVAWFELAYTTRRTPARRQASKTWKAPCRFGPAISSNDDSVGTAPRCTTASTPSTAACTAAWSVRSAAKNVSGETRSSGSERSESRSSSRPSRSAGRKTVPIRPRAPVISTRRGCMGRYSTPPGNPGGALRTITTGEPPSALRQWAAMNDLPAPTSRARHGRWLGGVCAGLAARWDVPPARVRIGFVLGALALGLGVLVYLAAWLILPVANEDGTSSGQRGIVLLAQACGALLGLAALAVGRRAPRPSSASAGWSWRSPPRCWWARSRAGPGSAPRGRCCRSEPSSCRRSPWPSADCASSRARRPSF